MQLRQPGNEHGYHHRIDTSQHNVEIFLNPTDRPISDWLGVVYLKPASPGDDRVPSPVRRSSYISERYTNRGIKPSSLGSSPPLKVWKPQLRWLKSLIGSSSTAPPHPRMIIEAHQPMGGSSAARGEDRVPCPIQTFSEYLQLQQHGDHNDDLPGRYFPARHVNPDRVGLFGIGW